MGDNEREGERNLEKIQAAVFVGIFLFSSPDDSEVCSVRDALN